MSGKGQDSQETLPNGAPSDSAEDDQSDAADDLIEPEILEKLPPEAKKQIKAQLSMMSVTAPLQNPLARKITPEHISRIIDLSEKDSTNAYKDTRASRRFAFGYVLIFVGLFVFLTIFLTPLDKDLYQSIITFLLTFLAGVGGGFGVKSYMDRNR